MSVERLNVPGIDQTALNFASYLEIDNCSQLYKSMSGCQEKGRTCALI